MRGLDLFAGIGLFGEGMTRAGVEVVGVCELADWKRMIHAELHGAMPIWRDIKDMKGAEVHERCGPIDIVFGSPPCTDASLANTNGKGISGSETGLFMEAIRIVREIRPAWVALENVPGLRSRGADGVLAELEQAGYAVWPIVVGADNLGAPHIRKRVWIVAHAADADSARVRQQPRRGGGQNGQGETFIATNADADANEKRELGRRQRWPRNAREARLISAVPGGQTWAGGLGRYLRVADGCPAKTARMLMSACGDGVVVEVAEAVGRAIVSVNHFTATSEKDW